MKQHAQTALYTIGKMLPIWMETHSRFAIFLPSGELVGRQGQAHKTGETEERRKKRRRKRAGEGNVIASHDTIDDRSARKEHTVSICAHGPTRSE